MGIGHGTTFTLTFPLHYVPDLDDGKSGPQGAAASRCGDGLIEIKGDGDDDEVEILPLRVLVVDDVTINRRWLGRLLEKAGHVVMEAVDCQDAVDKVADAATAGTRIDSILMDYKMPVMNGRATAKSKNAEHEHIAQTGVPRHREHRSRRWVIMRP